MLLWKRLLTNWKVQGISLSKDFIIFSIIVVYLSAVATLGRLSGGRQTTVKDYFLGSGNIPWWIICFSVVAAETSTLTFISIPGLAYKTNFGFLQVTAGYLLGRILVSVFFLPAYFSGELYTSYMFLEKRFGGKMRSLASVTFIFTRIFADGVRLFATAIPLKLLLGISYPLSILIIASMALFYTYTGGLKGVIWVEALQMVVYLGAAILSLFILNGLIPQGLASLFSSPLLAEKSRIINVGFNKGIAGFFSQPYTLIGGLIGGMFLSMASHGTDQLIVQRLLAAKKIENARKALIGSGIIIIFQFALFLLIGGMLYVFYEGSPIKYDEVFTMFIIQKLPPVASGIIIAGLLAAALSTLAGSVSSLSSSFMMDLLIPLKKGELSEARKLKFSKNSTVILALVLCFSALLFINSPKVIVELALSIASFTYGGLLGTFLAGFFFREVNQRHVIAGFLSAIAVMIVVILSGRLAWTWYTLTGVLTTIAVSTVYSKISPENPD